MILVTPFFGCPNNWVTRPWFCGLGIGKAKDCPGWQLDQPALDNRQVHNYELTDQVASRSSNAIPPFSSTAAFTAAKMANNVEAVKAAFDENGGIALDDMEATLRKNAKLILKILRGKLGYNKKRAPHFLTWQLTQATFTGSTCPASLSSFSEAAAISCYYNPQVYAGPCSGISDTGDMGTGVTLMLLKKIIPTDFLVAINQFSMCDSTPHHYSGGSALSYQSHYSFVCKYALKCRSFGKPLKCLDWVRKKSESMVAPVVPIPGHLFSLHHASLKNALSADVKVPYSTVTLLTPTVLLQDPGTGLSEEILREIVKQQQESIDKKLRKVLDSKTGSKTPNLSKTTNLSASKRFQNDSDAQPDDSGVNIIHSRSYYEYVARIEVAPTGSAPGSNRINYAAGIIISKSHVLTSAFPFVAMRDSANAGSVTMFVVVGDLRSGDAEAGEQEFSLSPTDIIVHPDYIDPLTNPQGLITNNLAILPLPSSIDTSSELASFIDIEISKFTNEYPSWQQVSIGGWDLVNSSSGMGSAWQLARRYDISGTTCPKNTSFLDPTSVSCYYSLQANAGSCPEISDTGNTGAGVKIKALQKIYFTYVIAAVNQFSVCNSTQELGSTIYNSLGSTMSYRSHYSFVCKYASKCRSFGVLKYKECVHLTIKEPELFFMESTMNTKSQDPGFHVSEEMLQKVLEQQRKSVEISLEKLLLSKTGSKNSNSTKTTKPASFKPFQNNSDTDTVVYGGTPLKSRTGYEYIARIEWSSLGTAETSTYLLAGVIISSR
ncbi:unnamed protein product [Notodromas monacha]|uniref:Peptidase S1 domain-containing protein n=1 Tax=Notodromas monacha TaxID=399045 RepID=A0A7R9BRA3_9CRUS|nr:unnamed protein product [Notodromas monacha]CAG0920237.1 unnamed protein product [Notodromas monacha]